MNKYLVLYLAPAHVLEEWKKTEPADGKNDVMLYAIVSAESHDAAAKSFVGHPHLQIPEASIEIMEIHPLPGMERASAGEQSRAHA